MNAPVQLQLTRVEGASSKSFPKYLKHINISKPEWEKKLSCGCLGTLSGGR